MLNVETQSRGPERTGICQRQLDGYYVRLVNSALNGEPFIYTRKGKEYNVLGELGKVGREYAKGGDEEKARIISNFLKMSELADSLEVTSTLAKSYRGKIIVDEKGNKWGVGFKVNEGGHPVDSYGRPIDLTRVEKLYFPGVDYSSKIDKVLEGKDSTFNVDDKESRVKARKDVWKSSMLTKAGNLISDGEIEIGRKYSEKKGDYGKAEKEFYAAAREFEAAGDKKSSTVLYARALACRMMKQGNYKSALHTLKTAGDKLYEAAFSELVKREELKDAKKFEETIEKIGFPEEVLEVGKKEAKYKPLEELLKNMGVPEGEEALIKYTDKLAKGIEAVLKAKAEEKRKYVKPEEVDLPEKPGFLDFKRSETVKLGKKIGNEISNVYKAAVSGEGKEPWETEIVKKTVSPLKKGYKSYRGFIDKVVIEGGDRLGDKLYRSLRKKEKVKSVRKETPGFFDVKKSPTVKYASKFGKGIASVYKSVTSKKGEEKPGFLDFKRSETVKLGKVIGKGFSDAYKSIFKGEEKLGFFDVKKSPTVKGIASLYKGIVSKEGNPLETEIVKKTVSPFNKGYQFYKGLIDKGIEKGDQLGEKIGVKIRT